VGQNRGEREMSFFFAVQSFIFYLNLNSAVKEIRVLCSLFSILSAKFFSFLKWEMKIFRTKNESLICWFDKQEILSKKASFSNTSTDTMKTLNGNKQHRVGGITTANCLFKQKE
jgi:hypothetical protein